MIELGAPAVLFQARSTTNTTLSSTAATWTNVPLDTEDFDSLNGHSTSTNTQRFTVPRAMTVRASATAVFNTGAATTAGTLLRGVRILKNGGLLLPAALAFTAYAGTYQTLSTPTVLCSLVPGDYLEIQAYAGLASAVLYADSTNGASMTLS